MKILILSLLFIISSGCATYNDYHNPQELNEAELAEVHAEDTGIWVGGYEIRPILQEVFSEDGTVVAKGNFLIGHPKKVVLSSGKYQFLLRCETRGVYNHHRINIELERGEKYTAYCLGQYTEPRFFNRIKGMLGFISKNSNMDEDKKKNQDLVNNMDVSK